jgi:hypothetical protein
MLLVVLPALVGCTGSLSRASLDRIKGDWVGPDRGSSPQKALRVTISESSGHIRVHLGYDPARMIPVNPYEVWDKAADGSIHIECKYPKGGQTITLDWKTHDPAGPDEARYDIWRRRDFLLDRPSRWTGVLFRESESVSSEAVDSKP